MILTTRLVKSLFAGLAVSIVATATLNASPILSVDFQEDDAMTETGFQAFESSHGTSSEAAQSFSATGTANVSVHVLGGVIGGRDRGEPGDSGSFTYGDLLSDLITNFQHSSDTASPADSIELGGLDPSTSYNIRIWSIDNDYNGGSTSKFYDSTGSTDILIGSAITNQVNANPTDNNDFSTVGQVTSNGQGNVTLGSGFSAGSGQINGFTLSPVPEPASLALLGLGGLLLLPRPRHDKHG